MRAGDHGEAYGVEAQFYQNEEFWMGQRFEPRMDRTRTRTPRAMAVAWAEQMRDAIEAYTPDTQ